MKGARVSFGPPLNLFTLGRAGCGLVAAQQHTDWDFSSSKKKTEIFLRKKLSNDWSRVRASARPLRPASNLFWVCGPTIARTNVLIYFLPTSQRSHASLRIAIVCCHMHTHPQSTYKRSTFYISYLKNILSSSYYLCFENRLHQYVLQGETNKTRPHMDIF